jgi:hypothetical protein
MRRMHGFRARCCRLGVFTLSCSAVRDREMAPKIRFLAEKNKTWTPARLN